MRKRPYKRRPKEITSQIMSKIKSKNTKPELLLRMYLRRLGYHFQTNYRKLPGSPDIAFVRKRVVVFVDGDFWHGNNWRLRGLRSRAKEFSKSKREYWLRKIRTNIQRDKRNNAQLKKLGYAPLRFWESEIRRDIGKVTAKIERTLQSRKPSL